MKIRNNKNHKPLAAIYTRVSTKNQTTDMQRRELKAFLKRSDWQLYKEFTDEGYSGKNTDRPAYNRMLIDAHQKKFNVLVVWKLDRLGRSLKDLINILEELNSLKIDFVSYDNQIDTTTPAGKLLFSMIGGFAEFERDLMSERVKAGLRNARNKGKVLGRPPIPSLISDEIKKLKKQGLSLREISEKTGISHMSVSNKLK